MPRPPRTAAGLRDRIDQVWLLLLVLIVLAFEGFAYLANARTILNSLFRVKRIRAAGA